MIQKLKQQQQQQQKRKIQVKLESKHDIVSEIGGVHFSNVTFGFTKLQLQLILF